jgi:selenocysteine lyase/cysteine desulfurase
MEGFEGRLRTAVKTSETFYSAMARHPRLGIERVANGTNLTHVTFKGVNPADVARRLAERGIALSATQASTTLTFGVNETWNRMTATDLIRAFEEALG